MVKKKKEKIGEARQPDSSEARPEAHARRAMASSSPVSQRFEYLAVGNEDGDILASWCVDDGENERKMALFARKLCRKSERMTHDRLLGPLNDTFYCMLSADSGRVPLVCVLSSSSKTLEKELVLRALRTGFAKEVSDDQVKEAHPGSLQESCAPLFDRLLKEYGVDKFAKVEKKVKAIKGLSIVVVSSSFASAPT